MAAVQQKIKESTGDKLFLTTIYILLSLVVIAVIYPLIFIISSSISSPAAVTSGRVWLWPVDISFKGFKVLLNTPEIITGYGNSIFIQPQGRSLVLCLRS